MRIVAYKTTIVGTLTKHHENKWLIVLSGISIMITPNFLRKHEHFFVKTKVGKLVIMKERVNSHKHNMVANGLLKEFTTHHPLCPA